MKNIKAILWDVDGVVITSDYSFSKHLQKYYLEKKNDMLDFFNGDFKQCSIGKRDLKDILEPRLKGWNWTLGVDSFVDFWLLSESKVDSNIIDMMKKTREKGITSCLATNQTLYRKDFLMNNLCVKDVIDRGYFSCDLGLCKPEVGFYQKIIMDLGLKAEEILVIDDDRKNIDSAKSIGMEGIFYENFEDIKGLRF